MATPNKSNPTLLQALTRNGIFSQEQMASTVDGCWSSIPEPTRATATTDDAAAALVVQYLDSYVAALNTSPAAPAAQKSFKKQAIVTSSNEQSLTAAEANTIASNAVDDAMKAFQNYQRGLEASITKVFAKSPSAKEKFAKVNDFVAEPIEDAKWTEWESALIKDDYTKTVGKGDKAKTEVIRTAAENTKIFNDMKAKYAKKEKFAIYKSEAKAPILGIEVTESNGETKLISKQPAMLAWELLVNYGGQLGDTESDEDLSAFIRVYTTKGRSVSGIEGTVPKVFGVISGLKNWYANHAAVPAYEIDTAADEKEVTVKSADFFYILKKNSRGEMRPTKQRISGKVKIKATKKAFKAAKKLIKASGIASTVKIKRTK